jgi:CRISPR/Cas system-associated protein Cas7 (RAMP superfamily)
MQKPKKIYNTISEAKLYYAHSINLRKKIINGEKIYPCNNCLGYAKIRDPYAYNDPIEGYKMASIVKCQQCNGTGEISKEEFTKLYKDTCDKYKTQLKEYNKYIGEKSKKIKDIKKKVNKEEIVFIINNSKDF